jgi:hypothetical protein
MSDTLRKAFKEAKDLKNRTDPRRVSFYDSSSGSLDPDVPMSSDLVAVGSPLRNVEKTPRTQRKKTSRERREKSYIDEDSLSESESDSKSESDDQLHGSQQTTVSNTVPYNTGLQQVNTVTTSHQVPIQQGQIQNSPNPLIIDEEALEYTDQTTPPSDSNNNGDGNNGQDTAVSTLLQRLLTVLKEAPENRQQRRAREHKRSKDDGRVPSELPEFSGKEGTISLEEWVSRLSQMSELRHWSERQLLYVMLCKLKPPALDYIYGLSEVKRSSVRSLIHELTNLYGATRWTRQDHYRELLRSPQQPSEKASDYINRTMVHYRHLTDVDRLTLLSLLITPEYSEQLRLANVQQFDHALPVLLDYERTLKNASALSRTVNQPTHVTSTINAIQSNNRSYGSFNGYDNNRKAREELDSLRDEFQDLIQELKKVVKLNNNQKPQQPPRCKLHPTSNHSDAECRKQNNNSNQSKGSRYHGSGNHHRSNNSSRNGRNDASTQDKSKNSV